MSGFWDPRVEVTVTVRANGEKFQAKAFVDPELWDDEFFREGEIRRLKQAILNGVGEKLHWRIDADHPA